MLTNDHCVIINQGFNLNVKETFRDYLQKLVPVIPYSLSHYPIIPLE